MRVIAAQPPFDAVVVEASGVADPRRIAEVGLADPALRLDGVVVLVDASAVLDHAGDPLLTDTLQRPLAKADIVVVNKVDGAAVVAIGLRGALPRSALDVVLG